LLCSSGEYMARFTMYRRNTYTAIAMSLTSGGISGK
jgi:hypothetical protein